MDYWAVGSLYKDLKFRIDLYFCMHKGETLPTGTQCIDQKTYPLEKIVNGYGSRYFTNSISYMIAYAIYMGYEKIILKGVDVDSKSEYIFERPSIAYWCGRAESEGIEVDWGKIDPCFLYGYEADEMNKVLNMIHEKRIIALREIDATDDEKAIDQWRGFMYALDILEREIKG